MPVREIDFGAQLPRRAPVLALDTLLPLRRARVCAWAGGGGVTLDAYSLARLLEKGARLRRVVGMSQRAPQCSMNSTEKVW